MFHLTAVNDIKFHSFIFADFTSEATTLSRSKEINTAQRTSINIRASNKPLEGNKASSPRQPHQKGIFLRLEKSCNSVWPIKDNII